MMKENRFWIKRIISLMLCLTMVLTLFTPVKAEAMLAKNKKAHKAYMAQVKADKKNYNGKNGEWRKKPVCTYYVKWKTY